MRISIVSICNLHSLVLEIQVPLPSAGAAAAWWLLLGGGELRLLDRCSAPRAHLSFEPSREGCFCGLPTGSRADEVHRLTCRRLGGFSEMSAAARLLLYVNGRDR